ncbi:hypothetical protein [Sphingomonas sp. PAMC 26605]|uniref:hypothetical protein n=1 Tax=Sphingomonas sp. PAMC 26605 TaxID=1112214 RepID=UPI00026CAC37|nr:hypothetical protein [Sphingomonas sp. PAMC 26605]
MSGDRPSNRRDRRVARALVGIEIAIVLIGVCVSLRLLTRPSLAMAALWVALFVAATAFAIIQRETQR